MVSVIVASYNKGRVLAETLDSVLSQTLGDWELIVVDDASTDHSWGILEGYAARDPRIRLHRFAECSGGPAAPRNRALEMATGEWVAVLDADDLWHERKLELQLAALLREGASFCSTAAVSFDRGSPRLSGVPEGTGVRWVDHGRLLRKNVIAASSVMVRADLLQASGFREDPRYRRVEDAECWLSMHRDRLARSMQLGSRLTFYRRGAPRHLKGIMAWRRYRMLRDHRVGGRPLGPRALPYFGVYAVSSIVSTLTTGGSFRSA